MALSSCVPPDCVTQVVAAATPGQVEPQYPHWSGGGAGGVVVWCGVWWYGGVVVLWRNGVVRSSL